MTHLRSRAGDRPFAASPLRRVAPGARLRLAYLALIELDVPNACLIHTREISEQLVALGHDVTVILPRPLRVQRWAVTNHVWVRWWGFDRLRELAFFVGSAWLLFRLFRQAPFDSAQDRPFDALYLREMVRHPFLRSLAGFLRLPYFVEVNGWALDDLRLSGASKRELRAVVRSQRRLLSGAAGIVVSTVGNAEKIIAHYGIPPERVMVQELGTNVERFAPGDKRRARLALGLPDEDRIILFAGSFHPHHDLGTLLEAFARLAATEKHVTLLMVGAGAAWEAIRRRVDEFGLARRVLLAQSRPYEEISAYFQAADVAVLPLTLRKVRQQNGCLAAKLWDYMAAGLPVIVTDLPETAGFRLVQDKTCVAPPEDPAALSAALRELLTREDVRVRLGAAALDYVRKHRTWRQAAEETACFIEKRLEAEGRRLGVTAQVDRLKAEG